MKKVIDFILLLIGIVSPYVKFIRFVRNFIIEDRPVVLNYKQKQFVKNKQVEWDRKDGKSFIFAMYILYNLVFSSNKTIVIKRRSLRHGEEFFSEMKRLYNNGLIKKDDVKINKRNAYNSRGVDIILTTIMTHDKKTRGLIIDEVLDDSI